ncbi:MAG: glutamine synthetase beta-grasp domain-containing protein, partial [Alphaproteobacteria bacterium]|nr:glutamine synthetase beta-grasp domain-containing protein [Alphaproteobacteria bacterium]
MSDVESVMKMIKENDVKFVDLRFTDPRGKLQHVTQHIDTLDQASLSDGFMFDGSSIAGWKAINESDMNLSPDLSTAVMDPFAAQATMAIFCDVLEPSTNQPYERCPRSTAKAAIAHMGGLGRQKNVEISHLVDPDSRLFEGRSNFVKKKFGNTPECV